MPDRPPCPSVGPSGMNPPLTFRHSLRVRYGETDQMGTFYHARALDWFECARSEFIRHHLGMSYAELEGAGLFLPVIEAHLQLLGRARYDDLLTIDATLEMPGRARLRFDMHVSLHPRGTPVVRGYTVHAFVDGQGRPIRPPAWFLDRLRQAAARLQTPSPENPPP